MSLDLFKSLINQRLKDHYIQQCISSVKSLWPYFPIPMRKSLYQNFPKTNRSKYDSVIVLHNKAQLGAF